MNDKQQIEICVQIYIDSMEQSDPNLVKQAFHPNGSGVGHLHDELMEMSVNDFAEFVVSQQPSPRESGEGVNFQTLSCEVEGTTALVKVRDTYLGITFLDTLSLIKTNEKWLIYNKLFHVESE